MNSTNIFELIGYAASILIAISLMMKSLIRLRIINGIGALIFVVYGVMINSYPVAFLNALIVLIDLYYLTKMVKRSDFFTLMEVASNNLYLQYFLEFHHTDICHFFPSFSYNPEPDDMVFFILRDTVPAGLVILRPEGVIGHVLLDYARKDYRDFKIGNFIFDKNAQVLINHGINCLEAESTVPAHTQYLRRLGFTEKENGLYQKKLS